MANWRSGIASVRAHAKSEQTKKTYERIAERLTENPDQGIRVTTNIAQWVLIKYPKLYSGNKTYATEVKNVGAGVKELYLKKLQ